MLLLLEGCGIVVEEVVYCTAEEGGTMMRLIYGYL
jgi:hypothetical protein